MYKNLLVAVDNSQWSDHALKVALELAQATGASLTATHVYAGRLHDDRFRQLEPSLPERYQSEEVIERQRGIHDALIGRGLALISDSYLDVVESRCRDVGVHCRRQNLEGHHYEVLLKAAQDAGADLVALGAHGLGHGPRSLLGSVCERVVRGAGMDALVARRPTALAGTSLVVAVDGSSGSWAAARRAIGLAKTFGGSLTALAVYDPFFHRVAFSSIATVLSSEAAKIFKFREQEVLHDEIIDSGLTSLYQGHLDRVAEAANAAGVPISCEVLQGKPYDALLGYVESAQPALLLVGRHGLHRGEGQALGSNTENLLRLATGNVLVAGERSDDAQSSPAEPRPGKAVPPLEWTPEAGARLQRVPGFARGMARLAIEKHARAHGYPLVTPEVVDEARKGFPF